VNAGRRIAFPSGSAIQPANQTSKLPIEISKNARPNKAGPFALNSVFTGTSRFIHRTYSIVTLDDFL
jgi:hypothetical protein